MIRVVRLFSLLGTILFLSGCLPTAYVTGLSNTPTHYTYTSGYTPPQTLYIDPITDSDNVTYDPNDPMHTFEPETDLN